MSLLGISQGGMLLGWMAAFSAKLPTPCLESSHIFLENIHFYLCFCMCVTVYACEGSV